MRRWARRLAVALVVFVALLSAPVVWIEGMCTAPSARVGPRPPALVQEPGYERRESDSYLSFPEWHIVYAYEDLAGVVRDGDESDFAYGGQIAAFWRSFCALNRVVTARGGAGLDTKVMLYTIGWSFTAELAVKGAYENTVGRLFEWLRGARKTDEDIFAGRDLAEYARFLRQTPWYEYPFGSRLVAFWRETPLLGADLPRKLERRGALTLEYGVKAIYGRLIGLASTTALGAADLEIKTVVVGLDASDTTREPRIKVVRELGSGRTLIVTPRYQAYTDLLVGLARRGRDVVEIAGNRRILVTVLAPPGPLPPLPGSDRLFELPIQSQGGRRRVGLDVDVTQLTAAIRAIERIGATIEHLYDY
jgi:hypothetical protein